VEKSVLIGAFEVNKMMLILSGCGKIVVVHRK